jgi:hypothetical protein
MKFISPKKDVFINILFFILYFNIFSVFLFSYYDLDFASQDELDYYYTTGVIDKNIYAQYLNNFEYFEPDAETEKVETKKETKKFKLKIGSKLNDYQNKTKDINNYLKFNYLNNFFDIGISGIDDNKSTQNFNKQDNLFVNERINKQLTLDKFYIGYTNPKTIDNIIIGNFRANLGMGLTFSKTNTTKEGLSGDLELPYQRAYTYANSTKKIAIANNYLQGLGLYEKIKNLEIYFIYSTTANRIDNLSVKNSNNEIEQKTINNLDYETIKAGYLGYNFLNVIRIGGIFYESKNEYFENICKNKTQAGKGLYFELNSNNFFYQNEISFVDNERAFINKFGFNNQKDFDFSISYRNYPETYKNDLANSLSLHPNPSYFRCNDEQGFQFNLKYSPEITKQNSKKNSNKNQKLDIEFQSDIFRYSKKTIFNKQTQTYDIFYYPQVLNKTYFVNAKYFFGNMINEFGYRFYDRDTGEISNSYYERKDEYFDYKIEHKSKKFDCSTKYTKKIRGLDVPDYKYFSEYFTFSTKLLLFDETYLNAQMNFMDSYMNKISDDKFSYIFGLNSKLTKNLSLKFKWYVKDDLNKKYFDLLDDDGSTNKETFYENELLNKWSVELAFKF